MRKPKLRIIAPQEVEITRNGEYAELKFKDPSMGEGMDLKIGPRVAFMTDEQIVLFFNEMILNMEAHRRENPYEATEIPEGSPQIRYDSPTGHWSPSGGVLRCLIDSAPSDEYEGTPGMPAIVIDDRELTWNEFGKLLSVYEGWGMRIVFVPDDELTKNPVIVTDAGKKP